MSNGFPFSAYLLLASSQMRTPVMLPAWLRWRCTADTTLEAWHVPFFPCWRFRLF